MNNIAINGLEVKFNTSFGSVNAVQNVNTVFIGNKITGIIGESGSGKSVMGMSILQLLPDSAKIYGECIYKNKNLFTLSNKEMQKIRGKEIGLIPQNPTMSLNPMLKIKRQLKEPILIHKLMNSNQANDEADKLLMQFGFEELENVGGKYPFQMSGGMNQRIVSAMGLSCKPPWIIADEPTKGLDAIMRNQVYSVLKKIYAENHCGMLMITHDLILASHLCHEIKVMYAGEIVEEGSCEDLFNKPLHPYTNGLLQSLPQNGMKPIPYAKDTSTLELSSCTFFNRCPDASPRCVKRVMEDFSVNIGRKVRCFNYA